MKFSALLGLLIAGGAIAHDSKIPHLDLEMTSAEYRAILKKNTFKSENPDPRIENPIALGERLSKWIALVNKKRAPSEAIRLTSATTRTGVPIDKPSIYNPDLIAKKSSEVLAEMPEAMKKVIQGKGELPDSIPMDDETFIKHARLLDKTYQQAARYKTVDQWRSQYIQAAIRDVRGYYYLMQNKIGTHELRDVNLIPASKKADIQNALITMCMNAYGKKINCAAHVEKVFKKNKLAELYKKTYPAAKENWENFFVIPAYGVRPDVKWSGNSATVPFNTPALAKFIPYLQENIEDEFKWDNWAMKLTFGTFDDGPRLEFKPGVVPHVNGLGGNIITMDSNQPIEEYESQWTIRHEFGHVLGLPDCYHEFYDQNLKAYVNYQLDVTDLMCSRAGNMNKRIYLELKKAYE